MPDYYDSRTNKPTGAFLPENASMLRDFAVCELARLEKERDAALAELNDEREASRMYVERGQRFAAQADEKTVQIRGLKAELHEARDRIAECETLLDQMVRCECGDDEACRFAVDRDAALADLAQARAELAREKEMVRFLLEYGELVYYDGWHVAPYTGANGYSLLYSAAIYEPTPEDALDAAIAALKAAGLWEAPND